jgi:MFS family permease
MRFAVLMYPFGAMGGYLTVALAYELAQNGVATEAIGALIAVSLIPNTWRFLWAPVLDITLSPRIWYTWSSVASALSIIALSLIPENNGALVLMGVLIFIGNVVITFNSMGVDIIAAASSPPEQKGRFGGWLQAGNLAGGGVGGGLALWIAQNTPYHWIAGAVVGASFLLCPLALVGLPSMARTHAGEDVFKRVGEVARDSWALARSRAGALAILVLFLPLGSGAASNLWSAIADDWTATANTVALVNGTIGGLVSGVGCLIGGYLCDRMDRKWSYALFGLLQAACAAAMAYAPHTESMYICFTMLYALIAGLCYAAFCSLTLEIIGVGSAATQYNLLACLSNMPIQYMTLIVGRAHTLWGASGMLYTEAIIATAGAGVYAGVRYLTVRRTLAPVIA